MLAPKGRVPGARCHLEPLAVQPVGAAAAGAAGASVVNHELNAAEWAKALGHVDDRFRRLLRKPSC